MRKLYNNLCVNKLHVGDIWQKWDIWNTANGLEVIPMQFVGKIIKYIQPRDIFLRSDGMPVEMTVSEFEEWNRRNENQRSEI